MATKSIFHPYKLVEQTDSSLQLGTNSKATIWILRLMPLIVPIIFGYVIATSEGPIRPDLIYTIIGITLFLVLVLSIIKSPAAVKLDSSGMLVTYVSLWGHKEKHVLWSDVDRIEYYYRNSKGGGAYVYRAITHAKKKIEFLNLSGASFSKKNLPEVNATLQHISGKNVTAK